MRSITARLASATIGLALVGAGWLATRDRASDRIEIARTEPTPAELASAKEGKEEKRPNDWFVAQRAYPGTEIDRAARSLALESARAMHASLDPRRGGPAWQLAGPTNVGGRVTALAATPGGVLVFAGAADGGVFRSTDGGANWEPIFDAVGVPSIGAIALDPQDPDVVYVGTGEANASGDSFAGEGLFRSTDGGDTWSALGLENSHHIGRIVVDPVDPSRIYVAAVGALFSKNQERGIYRTTNTGLTWERSLFLSDSTGAIDVVIDPSNPARLFAATWERIRKANYRRVGGLTSGVYASTDHGATWQPVGGGLPAPASNIGRIGLAIAPSNPQVIYAIYADDPGNFLGLYRSTNGGTTWARTNDTALASMFSNFGWYFANVRVSPIDPNRVYALGLDIWRSTNGGNSWSTVSGGVHVDQHDLWIDPTLAPRILVGCDGGVYSTTSGGTPWTHRTGMPISQFYAGTIDPQLPERLYGGLQDNGTVRTLTGALDDWDEIYGGDGFYCLVDPRNSNVIYAESQYGNLGKSVNGGASFNGATSGINAGDRRNWSTPVVMDPSNPDRLYYGTYRVYRSTNAAASWTAISSDLTGGPGNSTLVYATITTIAVAPSDPQRLYVGTDDARVWTSSNGGTNWQNVSIGLPNLWVTRLAVDPTNPQIAYAAHSGYRLDLSTAHLHRTTNGGLSWIPIDSGLPNAPVNAVVVDAAAPATLFAATDVGVYVTHDYGQGWAPLAPGLPITVVHDLTLHAPSRKLVAATHGRSMYSIDLGAPVAVDAAPRVAALRLDAPIPNPASRRGEIALRFAVEPGRPFEVALHDAAGRRLRQLAGSNQGEARGDGSAESRVAFTDLSPLATGVYFVRLQQDGRSVSQRLVLID